MTISVGTKVRCRQTGDLIWTVRRKVDTSAAEGNFWHLIALAPNGVHLMGRAASEHDLVEIEPAPSYEPGQVITHRGEPCVVELDGGDVVQLSTSAFARKLRAKGWVSHPQGSKSISKADVLINK